MNPLVSLRNSLNVEEDRQVMSVRSELADVSDLYLRIVSLDDFDGTTWKPSKRSITKVPDGVFPTPPGLGSDVGRTEFITTISTAGSFGQQWLPMPYPPSGVSIRGDWRYEPVGMTLVGDHKQDTRNLTYEVRSLRVQPTAEQLAAVPEPPSALLREYTELPDSLPGVVATTAREVTAGADTDYDRAVALQDYFTLNGGFEYDTEVDVGSDAQAIARFLRDKQGFCVHYSFAMASMARSLGIPARVAVGFAPGTPQADGTVAVGLRDAHAWPELYFEGWAGPGSSRRRHVVRCRRTRCRTRWTARSPIRRGRRRRRPRSRRRRPRRARAVRRSAGSWGRARASRRRRRWARAVTGRSGTGRRAGRWPVWGSWCCCWRRCCGGCGPGRCGWAGTAGRRRTRRRSSWASGTS
ncbi:hypothetical protein SHKM778_71440 [Streptomyces sp. KM77-8]|uniref:Transglutaminase-like domain-containing protein n=1 Tax=Streptomyces haneummycinicus TaxID=3074435 RepID=A0AAT9HTV2_9ACTN